MIGFTLTPPNSSSRPVPELKFKRSARGFSLKKPSLNFHKSGYLTARRSHDCLANSSTPSIPTAPVRASVDNPRPSYDDEVICISREHTFGSSYMDETSTDELRTPLTSPYASSYSSSSSSYHLPRELDDHPLSPVDEASDECDPRRGSQLSMTSAWVDNHLQELDLSYDEDCIYEIEIVTTDDGFLSRRDSFILPPGETFKSCQNPPVVPTTQLSRLSRPLPCTPPANVSFNLQSRRIRPLPPPPSPSW